MAEIKVLRNLEGRRAPAKMGFDQSGPTGSEAQLGTTISKYGVRLIKKLANSGDLDKVRALRLPIEIE